MEKLFIIVFIVSFVAAIILVEKLVIKTKKKINKKSEEIDKFIQNNNEIQGKIVECIVFYYSKNEGSMTKYIPVIEYIDQNNQKKLIACKPIEEEFGLYNVPVRYNDIGKDIKICIDKDKLEKASIDLKNGYFLGEKYSENEIKVGDYIQARKGVFVRKPEEKTLIYLMEDIHEVNKYINNLEISNGVVININNLDYLKRPIKNVLFNIQLITRIIYAAIIMFLLMFLSMTSMI